MIINSFHIEGFGLFSDSGIESLSPSLTLIYAENGGGKTTLRDFFRAMLFGFPRSGSRFVNKYPVLAGGNYAGRLEFTTRAGVSYRLNRGFPSSVVLHDAEGQPVPELAPLLGNTSLDLYKNLFAIGLSELQDADSLNSEQVKAMIGGAGSGHSGRALLSALKELNSEMEDRFKRGGQNPLINQRLATLENHQEQQRQSVAESANYWEHERELKNLSSRIEELRARESEVRTRKSHLELLDKAWADWVIYKSLLQTVMEVVPDVPSFPERGLERWEANENLVIETTTKARRLESDLANRQEQHSAIFVNESILQQEAAIGEAQQKVAVFEKDLDDIIRLRASIAALEERLDESLKNLGHWDVQRLVAFDDSLASMAAKAELIKSIQEVQAKLLSLETARQTLESEVSSNQKRAAQEGARFESQFPQVPQTFEWIEEKSSALRRLQACLSTLENLKEASTDSKKRLEEANQRVERLQGELELAEVTKAQQAKAEQEAAARLTTPTDKAPIFPFRPAACAVLGASVLLVLLSLKSPLASVVAFVLGLAGFAVLWRFGGTSAGPEQTPKAPGAVETTASVDAMLEILRRELDDGQKQSAFLSEKITTLQKRMQHNQTELETLGAHFNRTEPSTADCETIETQIARQRVARQAYDGAHSKLQDLQDRVTDAKQRLTENEELLHVAEQRVTEARAKWAGWLEARGLSGDMLPETFEEVHRQIQLSRGFNAELDKMRADEQRIKVSLNDFRVRTTAICSALGSQVPDDKQLPAQVQLWVRERDTVREANLERETLAEKILGLQADLLELEETRAGLELERALLLEQGGAVSSEEFVTRGLAWRKKIELEGEIKSKLQNLETLSAPGEKLRALLAELERVDREYLDRRLSECSDIEDTNKRELDQSIHEHGARTQEMNHLANEDTVARLGQTITGEKGELAELAEEWALRKLGYWLLERSRKKFQEERQPAVLRNAGQYLETISGGEFTRIVQPLGTDEYHLQRRDGSVKDAHETWNSGLKEQTYLSLRMGLIDDFSTRAEPLPVILDDALVNFDPDHLEGAIQCLQQFAQRQQVFYFTCHSHTLDLFAKSGFDGSTFLIRDGQFEKLNSGARLEVLRANAPQSSMASTVLNMSIT